ncbi:MAG: SURF1 family protein [Pseudomonadota bacterium]
MTRSSLIVTVLAAGALAVLIGLGTWQVQRLAWKSELTAKITARVDASPLSVEQVARNHSDGADIEYLPVAARGAFEHDRTVRVYALDRGRAGWHVYTPLRMANDRRVFVNRGFVPDPLDGTDLPLSEPMGPQTVQGLVRAAPATTSIFTPENDPEGRRFYWRSLSNMVAAVVDKTEVSFEAFFIDQRAAVDGETAARDTLRWPVPGTTRVKLSNRHLEYAITWYGLAFALAGVYAFFMVSGRRKRQP